MRFAPVVRFCTLAVAAAAISSVPFLARRAHATSLSYSNGNPGDWADSYTGNPISVSTKHKGGASGGGETTIPNLYPFGSSVPGAPDNGPFTNLGLATPDTAAAQSVDQSIAVYLDPTIPADQVGQFMLDATPNSIASNNYGGAPSPTLWGAEEDIIVTGTTKGITVAGSYYTGTGAQTFDTLATITTKGWYDLTMAWSRGAAGTDPVLSTLSVTDAATAKQLGAATNPDNAAINGGEADLYQSQYLAGPSYFWFTFWSQGFSGNKLKVSDITANSSPAALPEPGSLALFASGTGMLLLLTSRRRRRA